MFLYLHYKYSAQLDVKDQSIEQIKQSSIAFDMESASKIHQIISLLGPQGLFTRMFLIGARD